MALRNTSTLNFGSAIAGMLREYSDEVLEAMRETVQGVTRDAVKRLRSNSRAEFGSHYARGWTSKDTSGRLEPSMTIHGKNPTYRLAHLLERPHVVRNRYGTYGSTRGRTHIQPVDDWAMAEAQKRLKQKLEG